MNSLMLGKFFFPLLFSKKKIQNRSGKIFLAACYYMHSKDIVHRDLKPDNFLFLNNTDDVR